jgi:hypothetical protein
MRLTRLVTLIGGTLTVISITVTATATFADCKDEIEEVDKEMRDNRDKYTADALKDARKSLQEARRHVSGRSVECRREVLEARRALEKGKK